MNFTNIHAHSRKHLWGKNRHHVWRSSIPEMSSRRYQFFKTLLWHQTLRACFNRRIFQINQIFEIIEFIYFYFCLFNCKVQKSLQTWHLLWNFRTFFLELTDENQQQLWVYKVSATRLSITRAIDLNWLIRIDWFELIDLNWLIRIDWLELIWIDWLESIDLNRLIRIDWFESID